MRSLLALTLTLLVVAASPAGAATVHVDIAVPPPNPKFPEPSCATVVFTAAAGEANAVEVGEDAAGAIVVTERGGAPLTAHSGCDQQSPTTVVCAVVRGGIPEYRGVVAWLGDGDDRLTATAGTQAHGGAGNDTLAGLGTLFGEAGDDRPDRQRRRGRAGRRRRQRPPERRRGRRQP